MPLQSLMTRRLLLRPWVVEDLDGLQELWADPDVRRYLWDGEAVTREQAASVLQDCIASAESEGVGCWSLLLRERPLNLIGFCGFRFIAETKDIELLYALAPAYWGQRLASEAARAALRYGFRIQLFRRVNARTDKPNQASVRLLERLGMKLDGEMSVNERPTLCYSLRVEDCGLWLD